MDLDQVLCTIVANSGDSKCDSLAAIEVAKEGNFEEAETLLDTSMKKLMAAHEAHTEILAAEANGGHLEMKFIMIHASNNLSIGEITLEFAKIIVNLYKEVKKA